MIPLARERTEFEPLEEAVDVVADVVCDISSESNLVAASRDAASEVRGQVPSRRATRDAIPHGPVTSDEEQHLFAALRLAESKGRADAIVLRKQLASRFFPLTISVARRVSNTSDDLDDLIGHACVTLMRSIELFDHLRGFRFSTYVTRAIRSELTRYLVRGTRREVVVEPSSLRNVIDRRNSREVSAREFEHLERSLDRLEPRFGSVLRARYGLREEPGAMTLQAIADEMGLSRERVRQLESAALERLRGLA